MMIYEPSRMEIGLTQIAGLFLSNFYRDYLDTLPIQGNEIILDYGSGSGICAKYLAQNLKMGGKITCVDVSERWHQTLQKNLQGTANVQSFLGEIKDLAFTKNQFDAILIHFVLHDLPVAEREDRIQELVCLLNSGGRIFIREPLNPNHGIPAAEIKSRMEKAGLIEIMECFSTYRFVGATFSAIYKKS